MAFVPGCLKISLMLFVPGSLKMSFITLHYTKENQFNVIYHRKSKNVIYYLALY